MSRPWLTSIVGSLALTALMVAAGCDDDDDTPSEHELVIDTYNVGLAGAFIPYEEERREPLAEAIAGLEADIVCLQEVWRQDDKDLIINAASSTFPYSAAFEHNLETTVDDPTDQNGETPPPFTSAPCGSEDLGEALNAAVDCLRDNCSTIPGDENGQTTSTDCAAEACTGEVSRLLLGDTDALRCYGCIAPSLPTETFATIRDQCANDVNAGLAFDGQNGVVILSRHPLSNVRSHVLPGTWNRRIITRATATLPNDVEVDVYCNHLTPIFDGLTFPYTGQYGEGDVGSGGWAAEQLLQAEKLIALVEEESLERRAFVLGDFNAGRGHQVDGDYVIVSEGLQTYERLAESFTEALAPGYEPICTYCPTNSLNAPSTSPVWIDLIFMANVPAEAVLETSRILDQDIVEIEGSSPVPLSDHYGLRSVVTITP